MVNLFTRHSLHAQSVTTTGLLAFFLRQYLIIGHVSFGLLEGFLIAWLVDSEQDLILFHQLVIMDVNVGNKARNIRRNRDDIGAETRITRPRRLGVEHPCAENSDESQNDQYHGNGRAGEFSC